MVLTLSQALLALLLVASFSSFTWAVRKFFVRPQQLTGGLRLTLIAGTLFAFLHLIIIIRTPDMLPVAVTAGAAMYVLAMTIFWWAIAANRRKPLSACFAKNEPLHLVQHGPYRFVRHPFYCSYLLAWLAGGIATLNPLLAATAVVMFVLYLSAAVAEENKFAASSMAQAYEQYRECTGRFFPKPFRLMTTRHPQ